MKLTTPENLFPRTPEFLEFAEHNHDGLWDATGAKNYSQFFAWASTLLGGIAPSINYGAQIATPEEMLHSVIPAGLGLVGLGLVCFGLRDYFRTRVERTLNELGFDSK